jgi:hypothetical protein
LCDRCHSTADFSKTKFDHNDPNMSVFALEGRHREAKCGSCHVPVDIDGRATARYKPLPTDCAGCHADEHAGRFDGFAP